jgi:putative PIN family toxin of toxin-antitoxin system
MRVVIDTNVFVSAALKEQSLPGTAAHLAAANHLLLKSTITERELFVTLARPRLAPLIPPRFRDWLSEVLAAAELVPITERIAACRDPKDDKFPRNTLPPISTARACATIQKGRCSARSAAAPAN